MEWDGKQITFTVAEVQSLIAQACKRVSPPAVGFACGGLLRPQYFGAEPQEPKDTARMRELESLRAENRRLGASALDATEKRRETRQELETAQMRIATLQEERGSLRKQVQVLEATVAELKTNAVKQTGEYSTVRGELDVARMSVEALRAEVAYDKENRDSIRQALEACFTDGEHRSLTEMAQQVAAMVKPITPPERLDAFPTEVLPGLWQWWTGAGRWRTGRFQRNVERTVVVFHTDHCPDVDVRAWVEGDYLIKVEG